MTNPLILRWLTHVSDLEDILQCPICFDELSIPVYMCINGHHVCEKCLHKLEKCPYCSRHFQGTRNYLVEVIMTKFKDIKTSLLDPQDLHKNVACVETQTDPVDFQINQPEPPVISNNNEDCVTKENSHKLSIAPIIGKGKYPCRILDCSEEFPHGRMISHIRYYHNDNLIEEKISKTGYYNQFWNLEYKLQVRFDRAISIHNMGLFFLNLFIDKSGDLYGNLQIVNTRLAAEEFQYILDITNPQRQNSISYKGTVLSCRVPKAKLTEKCLFINQLSMSHLLKERQAFICKLTITRILNSEFSHRESNSNEIIS